MRTKLAIAYDFSKTLEKIKECPEMLRAEMKEKFVEYELERLIRSITESLIYRKVIKIEYDKENKSISASINIDMTKEEEEEYNSYDTKSDRYMMDESGAKLSVLQPLKLTDLWDIDI